MKFNRSYVCEPNNISITAENTPHHSKGIKLIFYFDNKEAFATTQGLPTYIPDNDDIDNIVRSYCNLIKGCTKRYIQDRFPTDKVMVIMLVNKSLKTVRAKTGKLIWRS